MLELQKVPFGLFIRYHRDPFIWVLHIVTPFFYGHALAGHNVLLLLLLLGSQDALQFFNPMIQITHGFSPSWFVLAPREPRFVSRALQPRLP